MLRDQSSVLAPLLAVLLALLAVLPATAQGDLQGDSEVAFAYGVAALRRGEADEAVRLLGEATRLEPENGTALYFLGLAQLARGDAAAAVVALEAAAGAEKAPRVERSRFAEDLARARRLASAGSGEAQQTVLPALGGEPWRIGPRPRFEGRLGLAAGSDSNPALLPDDGVLFTTMGLVEKESDSYLEADLRLLWTPYYGEESGSFGIAVEGGQLAYGDLDFLDLTHGRVRVQLATGSDPAGWVSGPLGPARLPRGGDRFSLLLQAGGGRSQLDGEAFASSVEAAVTAVLRGARGAGRAELSWRDFDYEDDLPDELERSGSELSLGLGGTAYLGRRDRSLSLTASWGQRDAGLAYDADLLEVEAALASRLGERLFFYATGSWRREDYDDPASNPLPFFPFVADSPRQDTVLGASASLSLMLSDSFYITGRASWSDRDAQLDFFDLDYQRTTASVGLSWIF